MTLTLDVPPEAQVRLETAAAERGQAADVYIRESFQIWLSLTTPDTEEAYFEDMRSLALPTLSEYWLNEEDAVYDTL
jgi:hypothetical protein